MRFAIMIAALVGLAVAMPVPEGTFYGQVQSRRRRFIQVTANLVADMQSTRDVGGRTLDADEMVRNSWAATNIVSR